MIKQLMYLSCVALIGIGTVSQPVFPAFAVRSNSNNNYIPFPEDIGKHTGNLPSQSNQKAEVKPDKTIPKYHRMNLTVSSLEDIKIKEGQPIKKGQIIGDKSQERKQLEYQLNNIKLAINKLNDTQILKPLAPRALPEILPLPDADFSSELVAISSAELTYTQSQRTLELALKTNPYAPIHAKINKLNTEIKETETQILLQQEKLNSFQKVADIYPEIILHEQQKLTQLQNKLTTQQSDLTYQQSQLEIVREQYQLEIQSLQDKVAQNRSNLQLAHAKYQQAITQRKQQEYQHSINVSKQVESLNQNNMRYGQQLQEYEQQLRNKDYQLSQLLQQQSLIESKLKEIAVVRSPYQGTIKRVRYENQTNNNISVAITVEPTK